jgi:hypothetical protein
MEAFALLRDCDRTVVAKRAPRDSICITLALNVHRRPLRSSELYTIFSWTTQTPGLPADAILTGSHIVDSGTYPLTIVEALDPRPSNRPERAAHSSRA